MNFDPNQPNVPPYDKKNVIIFLILVAVLWFSFDHFIMKPRIEAMKKYQAQQAELAPQMAAKAEEQKIIPRAERIAEDKRITISTPEISGSFPVKGNRIDDISLNNYAAELHGDARETLMSPSNTDHPNYAETGWLSDNTAIPLPDKNTIWTVAGNTTLTPDTPVTMTWDNGAGLTFTRTISIDKNFLMSITNGVVNNGANTVALYPFSSLTRVGIPPKHGKGIGYEGPMGYIADELHEISYSDLMDGGAQKFNAMTGWIGFGDKYWLSALIPPQMQQAAYAFQIVPNPQNMAQSVFQVDMRGDKMVIAPQKTVKNTVHLFVGAKKVDLLNQYEEQLGVKHFDLAVDFGVLYFLTKPLYYLLNLFYGWVGNFGVAIIMLTILVRGAVYPLASKSYRSFAGLRKVAPKMQEIKEKYAHDKQRLHQEIMNLYQQEKVNPMAGCFPILLQMPIFFAIYKVMSIAVEMRHAPFFGWIHDLSEKDPLTVFNLFGLLPFEVPSFLMIGPWSILMLVLMLIQKQLNPPPQDKIQKDMMNFMPWIMTYVLSGFASGLVIYWAFSNLLSVLQQAYIMKSMNVPIYLFSPDEAREHHASFDMKKKSENKEE